MEERFAKLLQEVLDEQHSKGFVSYELGKRIEDALRDRLALQWGPKQKNFYLEPGKKS